MVYVSSCSPKIGLSAALFAPGFLYENLYMDQLRSLASTSSEYINMTSNENSDTYRHLSQDLYVDSHTMDAGVSPAVCFVITMYVSVSARCFFVITVYAFVSPAG